MNRFKTTIISTIAKKAAIVAGILVSTGGVAIALNWTFLRRLVTYPEDSVTNVDWYQPLETVVGNPSKLP